MTIDTQASMRVTQRGVAVLAVAIVLLVASSLIVFFANRGLVFEQRASANQLRAARALAAAESGLEWAMARLNDPRRVDPQCNASAVERLSFSERYAPWAAGAPITSATSARPGCQLEESALACTCPQAAAAPLLRGDAPTFTIELAAVAGDPEALLVTSRGCTSAARECVPGIDADSADATAVVQVLVKLLPPWRALPVAAVTAGGSVDVEAGVQLVNTDAAAQGLLIDTAGRVSGTGLSAADGRLVTVPGSPLENAVLQGDVALSPRSERAADALFVQRYGQSLAQFRANPAVRSIAACATSDCPASIAAAGAEGYSAFYVEGDLQLDVPPSTQAVGSEARPALLVVTGKVGGIGAAAWHGLVHTTGATEAVGVALQGAWVSQGDLRLAGGTRVAYAPAVLQRLRTQLGSFVRVPGSWRDGRCASDDPTLPCSFAP